MRFDELNFHPDVAAGIADVGFDTCTDVQARCFAHTLQGKDITAQSQTGTGKTAAFLITIFQRYMEGALADNRKAMVIAPTRELAAQIEEDAVRLSGHLPIRMVTIYGGVGYGPQQKKLEEGVELIIGTPGRILDLARNRHINFKDISILVIDEADRLFDLGFLPDLRRMLRQMPPWNQRQTMLFSATLNMRVKALAWDHMNNPAEVRIDPENVTVEEVEQVLYHVGRHEKLNLLLGILHADKPKNAVIFTNTKHTAVELAKRLTLNGYKCGHLIGDMTQAKRLKTVEHAKSGELPFLVATDVASRGLHIEDLALVVNYDLPEDPESYVHRIGRTARVGREGKAVSLACEKFIYALPAIEKYIQMEIPVGWAEDDMFREDESTGVFIQTRVRPARPGRDSDRRRDHRKPRIASRQPGSEADQKTRKKRKRRPKGAPEQRPRPAENKPTNNGKNASREDRLAYYRQKYGENFTLPEDR